MKLTLYTKACCPLCDKAKRVVEEVRREIPFELEEVDIETDPALKEAYRELIPVLALEGSEIFYGKVSGHRLREILRQNAESHGEVSLSPRYRSFLTRLKEILKGSPGIY